MMSQTLSHKVANFRLSWVQLCYFMAFVVILVDQISKWLALHLLNLGNMGPVILIPKVFRLSLVWNHGVTFGLFRSGGETGRWILVGLSAIACLILLRLSRNAKNPIAALGLGLILGGAVGNNLIDRVFHGAVVDFLDFSGLGFPWVFNVADISIDIGVGFLILDMLFPELGALKVRNRQPSKKEH